MHKKEKIKKVYQKLGIKVGEDIIERVLTNKERLDDMMRVYKNEEIDSMNDIFSKDYSNKVFTKEELEFASKIDLFDPNMIKVAKMIWKHKNNPQMLNIFLKIAKNEEAETDIELINSLKEMEVIA